MQDNLKISDKEFVVIRELSNNNKPTQRHIAKKTGISLGLTNLIIKRLIKKGYVKITTVPPRTIRYMLTPKGFAEKTKKSYYYTLRTIDSIKTIKENIQDIITELYNQGAKEFIIFGNGELTTLTEIALRDLNFSDINCSRVENKSNIDRPQCDILFNKEGRKGKIDILSQLSKRGVYY